MLKFLFKPRSRMAEYRKGEKQVVKSVKINKFELSSHAQNRIVDRRISKHNVLNTSLKSLLLPHQLSMTT